ncbi:hypothetical protein MmiHf6_05090 [Methanimicrococcus hongohii]|uniref:Transmembrane protein n=1 Tax=Methanimicrococcus hongohii TaxID=3028295 RepID=A0AA96UYY9_9EURY|nr:hypothetical protein [Methanimicrococcus sp. Hf6]WNY23204.1 hypothetical protein MmiHf6_05090 [Methanimicrococcus sp. Hf6]
MADSSQSKQKNQSRRFLVAAQLLQRRQVCNCLLRLPLANQVCVSVCICSYLRNPFAFANVLPSTGLCFRCYLQVCVSAATYRFVFPLLPTGFCFRCYLHVSVSAATYRFLFPSLPSGFCFRLPIRFLFPFVGQVCAAVAAAGTAAAAAAAREPLKFKRINKKGLHF